MADIRNQQWRISVSAKCRSLHFKAVVWRLLPGWTGVGRNGDNSARFSALLNLGNARLQIDSATVHKMGEGRWGTRSRCSSLRILAKLFRFRSRVSGICKSVWRCRLGRRWKRLLARDHLAPTMQDLSFITQPPSWKTLREVGKLKVILGKEFIEVAVSYVLHVIIQLVLSHFSMKFGRRSKFIGFIVIKALIEKVISQPQMIEGLKFK